MCLFKFKKSQEKMFRVNDWHILSELYISICYVGAVIFN